MNNNAAIGKLQPGLNVPQDEEATGSESGSGTEDESLLKIQHWFKIQIFNPFILFGITLLPLQ